jgi:alpha-L-arabinofuranosidase
VNLDPHHEATVTARIEGASARSAIGQVLTSAAMDAHNTFENPHAIEPKPFKGVRSGAGLVFRLPPKAVAVVAVH